MTDYITAPASTFQALLHLRRHIDGTKGFIAGGAFKNLLSGEPVKDIDVFFTSQKDWRDARKILKGRGYKKVYSNARVVAYVDPITSVRVELVGSKDEDFHYGDSPEDTISGFDFTVTKFALWLKSGKKPKPPKGEPGILQLVEEDEPDLWMVAYHPQFFEHLHLKRLVVDADMVKPLSTFERSLRYTSYGFKLCRESKVKLIRAVQETDFASDDMLSASFYDGID